MMSKDKMFCSKTIHGTRFCTLISTGDINIRSGKQNRLPINRDNFICRTFLVHMVLHYLKSIYNGLATLQRFYFLLCQDQWY